MSTADPKVLKDLDEPKMTCKAYCGRVITEWLSRELATANLNRAGLNEEIRWAAVTVTLAKQNAQARIYAFFGNGKIRMVFSSQLLP